MTPKTIEVRIGGILLRVPTYKSEAETLEIVERINMSLKELEESSTRVNTQMFALHAAYVFAKETSELRDEMEAREEVLLQRIAQIQADIDQLRDEMDATV